MLFPLLLRIRQHSHPVTEAAVERILAHSDLARPQAAQHFPPLVVRIAERALHRRKQTCIERPERLLRVRVRRQLGPQLCRALWQTSAEDEPPDRLHLKAVFRFFHRTDVVVIPAAVKVVRALRAVYKA